MEARLKLKPGQKGTKKLLELYGQRLVCVRYRYDEQRQKRFKTVELILGETPWTPKPKPVNKTTIVNLRVELKEAELQRKVKSAGGKWNPAKRLWEISYGQAIALGLEDRIRTEKASDTRNRKASNTR